jgi:hypothetical protein
MYSDSGLSSEKDDHHLNSKMISYSNSLFELETLMKNKIEDKKFDGFSIKFLLEKMFIEKKNKFDKDLWNYFTPKEIVNEMITLSKNKEYIDILNLNVGYGEILLKLEEKAIGLEMNSNLGEIAKMNGLLNKKKLNLKIGNYLTDEIIDKNFDLIIADFPHNIRNIIHATCNSKIKDLKIRGTKSEPLILQLIMTSLKVNGKAILNVPNSLLFGDSKQHSETRKYLIDNFNILEIISVSDDFQLIKGYKSSIIVFEKTSNKNDTILINKLNNYGKIKVMDLMIKEVIKNNYNLYFEKYLKTDLDIKLKKITLEEIITFNKDNFGQNLIFIPEFCLNKKIEITSEKRDKGVYLVSKDESKYLQKFLNFYLEDYLKRNIQLFTQGKLLKINLELLDKLLIPIPSISAQNKFISYMELNQHLIKNNLTQIEDYNKILIQFLSLNLISKQEILLKDFVDINNSMDRKSILVKIPKNTINAGKVSQFFETEVIDEKNNYYLSLKSFEIIPEFLYFMIKVKEDELIKLSNLNPTILLNKTNLENLKLPLLSLQEQEKLLYSCKIYQNMVDDLHKMNYHISHVNVMEQLKKLEVLV